jgi:hypothetical protein
MMTSHARESEQQKTERRRAEMRIKQNPQAEEAAHFLVDLALPHLIDTSDAVARCMSNLPAVRQLYRIAARRLHPDHNYGEHLPKWHELQEALKTLRTFHDLETSSAESR